MEDNKNNPLVKRFVSICKDTGLTEKTIKHEVYTLWLAQRFIGKPPEDWTAQDVSKFFEHLKAKGNKTATVANRQAIIKGFFTKLENGEMSDSIKVMKQYGRKMHFPKQLVNRGDLMKMLEACKGNLRDKSLIHFLFESACRKGEAQTLKICEVEFDEYGAVAMVEGKTGQRRIRVIECVPVLKQWLNQHPQRENPKAVMWPSFSNNGYGGELSAAAIFLMVDVLGRRAKLPYHVYPHLLRHSRLTELASIMTEYQMRVFAGWATSSDMCEIYIHRAGVDTEDPLLEAAGIFREKKNGVKTSKVVCPACQKTQMPDAAFCYSCGQILETEAGRAITVKPSAPTKAAMEKEMKVLFDKWLRETHGEKTK